MSEVCFEHRHIADELDARLQTTVAQARGCRRSFAPELFQFDAESLSGQALIYPLAHGQRQAGFGVNVRNVIGPLREVVLHLVEFGFPAGERARPSTSVPGNR